MNNEQARNAPLILDGRATAKEIRESLRSFTEKHLKEAGRAPKLAAILTGDNPASKIYVRNKKKAGAEVLIETVTYEKPADISQRDLVSFIWELNIDPDIDGILLQLPLPEGLDPVPCLEAISKEKDVDGLCPANQSALIMSTPGHRPCTPAGVIALLDRYNIEYDGKRIVMIGRSHLVGRPLALMLGSKRRNGTVTLCHSHTKNLGEVCRSADIVIAAIGHAKYITADMIRPGAVVIDIGINRDENGKICGDVDFEHVAPLAKAITPVPGGIGPMTISQLLVNTVHAWEDKLLKKK